MRYTALVITRTSLFSSLSFFLSKSAGSVLDENAMVWPSGDQMGPLAPFGVSVSGRASPPSIASR